LGYWLARPAWLRFGRRQLVAVDHRLPKMQLRAELLQKAAFSFFFSSIMDVCICLFSNKCWRQSIAKYNGFNKQKGYILTVRLFR
jgi:hypothetical protein